MTPSHPAGSPDSVAVVGAGVAGLALARRLARAGRHVVVFEKSRGCGGRAATRRRDEGRFDHGAQYFTCRGEAFGAQLREWQERGVVGSWETPLARLAPGGRVLDWDDRPRFVGVPGMSALGRDLAVDLDVHLTTRIQGLERGSEGWRLVDEAGDRTDAYGRVVLAVPAPQASELLDGVSPLVERMAAVEIDPCLALMLTFATPIPAPFEGGAVVVDSPLAWIARDSAKPGRPQGDRWVLHATPQWSARQLEAAPETWSRILVAALRDAIGRDLPVAAHMDGHRWRFARTRVPLGEPYLLDLDAGLAVCGDWTLGHRLEDAFDSGVALAERLLES